MQKFRYFTLTLAGLFLLLCSTAAEAFECDPVPKESIFKTKYITNSLYGKYILLAELLPLSKKEADKFFSVNRIMQIEGVPVGTGFSSGQYNIWKNKIKQEINVEKIANHVDSIYISEADEKVLSKWQKCMEIQRGLLVRLESVDKERVFLKVKWLPYDLMNPKDTRIIPKLLKGARPSAAGRHLKVGNRIKLKHHQEMTFPLRRKKGEPLWVIIAGEDTKKTAEVYLPPIVEIPPISTHLRVEYNYDCAEISGETVITIPGQFTVYVEDKSSGHGKDIAECHVTEDGLIQAYNHDGCCPGAEWGTQHLESSMAKHGPCTIRCTVSGTYPGKK